MKILDLERICRHPNQCKDHVPIFVIKCVELINKHINKEGLLRKEPKRVDVDNLEKEIKKFATNTKEIEKTLVNYCNEKSVHVIGSILKRFLRNLTKKLISNESAEKISKNFEQKTQNNLKNTFEIINLVEIENRCTMNKILAMAKNIGKSVIDNKKKNKDFQGMDALGLGRVLSECFHHSSPPQKENTLQPWLSHMIKNHGVTYTFSNEKFKMI